MVARQSRRLIGTLVFLALALVVAAPGCAGQDRPRNVIFMIGDGMGFEHVRAASLYEYGREGALAFEKYYRSEVTTDSIGPNGKMVVTDSAAAATALATGHKVRNGVLSQDEAGEPYVTILEELKAQGKATGLVTTVYLTHATPAGYGAHAPSRKALGNIAGDLLRDSRPNVMLGAHAEGGEGLTPESAGAAGYQVCTTDEELVAIAGKVSGDNVHVAGLFGPSCLPYEYDRAHPEATGTGQAGMYAAASASAAGSDPAVLPTLAQMTTAALAMLEEDKDGFFLMVEGGTIDWAGHANHLERAVYETVGFEKAYEAAEAWAVAHPGTLIVVTADHETGGLKVVEPGAQGEFSTVTWASKNHTATKVGVYAVGPGAERFAEVHDNIDIHRVLRELTIAAEN